MLIYYIQDKDTEETYFGSTSRSLETRMSAHRSKRNPCVSRDIIIKGNYKYGILEDNHTNEDQLLEAEKFYIQHYPCINKRNPNPTWEELLSNKKALNTKYKKTHKYYKERIDCPCGGHYRQNGKNEHKQSLRHKKYESDISITPEIPS